MARDFDLVILGSGSTAFAAALRAKELGKTAAMTESRTVGGTCVNRGCLPSKNLIEAAKLLYDARHPRYPGLSPAAPGLDFRRLIGQKDEVIHEYRSKRYERLVGGAISIAKGHARFLDAHTLEVDGMRLAGEAILIATGSRPVIPPIDGLSEVPFLTSDLLTSGEGVELTECPRSLIVLGGGYIGLELGQMFRRFGTEVTLLDRHAQLLVPGYEPEAGQILQEIFEAEEIRVVTGAVARAVRREGNGVVVTAQVGGEPREFRAEHLLVATGRRPNTDAIAIERAGVALGERGQVRVDEYLRTSVPHIFAAGDVIGPETGSQMATPVGSQDGGIAAHNALSGRASRRVDHRVIPRVIFTDPPIATVGTKIGRAHV